MKTTVELSDELLQRAKAQARRRGVTLRQLLEEGLRQVLNQAAPPAQDEFRFPVFRGRIGLRPEFENATWEQVRDEIYRVRGA